MSMAHVNPNSPQTRAWVEYANKTEGRIMPGEFPIIKKKKKKKIGLRTNSIAEMAKRKKEQMHSRICKYLDLFAMNEWTSKPALDIISRSTNENYTRILRENGYIESNGKLGRGVRYRRIRYTYPTIEQVAG